MIDTALVLGIYGAALSTLLAVRQFRNERRTVRITSVPAYNGAGFHPVGQFIRVTIANHRANAIYIRAVFLSAELHRFPIIAELRDMARYRRWIMRPRLHMHLPDDAICEPPLPAAVQPGRALIVWLSRPSIEKALVEAPGYGLRLSVQDETDQTITGPRLRT